MQDSSVPEDMDDAGHTHPDAGRDAATGDLICSFCGRCEEVFPLLSRDHTTNAIYYADPPPTNGPHNPCWAKWGVHPTEVVDDRWVHNLEHGGVVFLYNCPDGCPNSVTALERMATSRRRTLLTPYKMLPTRFGIVAWNRRLLTDCLDEEAFAAFYDKNFDHGWESLDSQPDPSCPP